jgi:hypothetical protein
MSSDTTICSVQDTNQAQDRAVGQVPEVDDKDGVDRTAPMSAEEWQSSRRAAWAIGRQLACLQFWLCQAWLTVYHEPSCRLAERAESIWDDLALTVREAVQRIRVRDLLCDMVRAAQELWGMMFHSAWHVDAVWGANASIEKELDWYPEMSERRAREEGCDSLLREVDHLLGKIQSEIEEHLDEDQVAVMRLALLVYEVLYPRHAYRYMLNRLA